METHNFKDTMSQDSEVKVLLNCYFCLSIELAEYHHTLVGKVSGL